MSSDDQYFLDLLSSIPSDIKRYSLDVADAIDRSVDHAAIIVKNTLATFDWLPESARQRIYVHPPSPPPPAPVNTLKGLIRWGRHWVSEHRAVSAAVVAFAVTGTVLVYRQRKQYARKRRAKRNAAGQRTEVVVVAGSLSSPLTKSIVLDLERRGFVVYVIVRSVEEENQVKSESRVDLRSLYLDITNPFEAHDAVENFRRSLDSTYSSASPNGSGLHLAGLLVVPEITCPAGPVEIISPEQWSDNLNVKVLSTIVTTQAFLSSIRQHQSRILLLTPSITPALQPPFHGVENTISSALEAFFSTLTTELSTAGAAACHFKLGLFHHGRDLSASMRSQTPFESVMMTWPAPMRAIYGRNYLSLCDGLRRSGSRGSMNGSPVRELHNAVFDALTQARPARVWHVGRGSLLYERIQRWVPRGVLGWMMGLRQLSEHERDNAKLADSVQSLQWETVEKMA